MLGLIWCIFRCMYIHVYICINMYVCTVCIHAYIVSLSRSSLFFQAFLYMYIGFTLTSMHIHSCLVCYMYTYMITMCLAKYSIFTASHFNYSAVILINGKSTQKYMAVALTPRSKRNTGKANNKNEILCNQDSE